MNVQQLLTAALAGVSCGPPYPGVAPDDSPGPYVVLPTAMRTVLLTHGGPTNLQRDRVQLDCYAATYLAAESIAQEVEALMNAQSLLMSPTLFGCTALTHDYMGVDPDVKLHRVMLEFGVWFKP